MKFPWIRSETGGDAGRNHLEEDRGAVMDPQHRGAEQNGGGKDNAADDDPERRAAKRASVTGAASITSCGGKRY
jgi:hypothetical protein